MFNIESSSEFKDSKPLTSGAQSGGIVVSRLQLSVLVGLIVCLATATTYLGVALYKNEHKSTTYASGLSPDEMVALWKDHTDAEFVARSVNDTMLTVGESPFMYNIPTRVGGNSTSTVDLFYTTEFINSNPPDIATSLISRTIGDLQIVDEMMLSFTHTTNMPWLLPNIPPTNLFVELPIVVIVGFGNSKIIGEHIYWDQASVLMQVGLLNNTCCGELSSYYLPMTGAMENSWIPVFYN